MATLKEIAQKAGVSVMTVSNVVNGKTEKVSKETLERIQSLIKEYNYVPNLNARSLVKNNSQTIVVFVSTFVSHENVFKDPYLSEFFGEIENLIRQNGYYVLIQTIDAIENAATLMKKWKADGAVFISPVSPEKIHQLKQECDCPIVFIDSCDSEETSLTVGINEFKGGFIATKHLLTLGHRKIGIAGYYDKKSAIVQARYQGYIAALKEFGLDEKDAVILHTVTTYEAGLYFGGAIANHEYDITAVFATADLLAIGIMEGARRNGCIVPRDLSVVGFDNLSVSQIVTPKLTSVSQDLKNKAAEAVELLFKAIRKEEIAQPHIICDVQLELRQSVLERVL
ncbi:LacI family DNA-binding transcriptional regulator [uncultured Treponema sp.]|uniref:LacI family DNA-binding transcriptional regulator n=1 Tax=uncultured Treponema sp. TaxID=162155 RepID=UPI0025EB2D62|nr:LacI family DNA-binding transcriptional regulator [uncultured Treponema sp.]